MSGKNQHYIPQAVLGAFCIPEARTPQVRVYRREKSFPSAINNVAAEDYFYSRPADDGSETLDDILTRHENGQLNDDLCTLAEIQAGPVDPLIAARVIAHLTGRGDHVRGLFRASVPALAELVDDLFGTTAAVASALGAEGPIPGPRFQTIIAEHVAKDELLAAMGLPTPLLMSVGYTLMRENAKPGFEQMSGLVKRLTEKLRGEADVFAREAQGKSLGKAPVADGWVQALTALRWRIEAVGAPLFVLPDFIGLASDSNGASGTIFGIGGDALRTVLMPLSPTRMLIGEAGPQSHDLTSFNLRAAPHCLAFFVSAYTDESLDNLRSLIGMQAEAPIRDGLLEAATQFRQELDAPATPLPLNAGEWRETPWCGFEIHSDLLSKEELERFGGILGAIASRARMRFDVDQMLRVIVEADYAAALARLTTVDGSAPTLPSSDGWSAAYNIDVEHEGGTRVIMLLHPDVALMLLSEEDLTFGAGASVVLGQLTKLGTHALLRSVFGDHPIPGIGPDRLLLPHVLPAWECFYIALEQCRFAPQLPAFYRDRFLSTLAALPEKLFSARQGYWQSGVIDDLIGTAILPIGQLMIEAASAAAAIERDEGADLRAFCETLDSMGLLNWFQLFSDDLQAIWLPGCTYPAPEAFHVLARHAERLLVIGGFLLWDDGSPFGRIDVLNDSAPEEALED